MGRPTHAPGGMLPTHSKFVKIVVGIVIIAAAYYVITRIALSVLTSSLGRLVVSPGR